MVSEGAMGPTPEGVPEREKREVEERERER